MLQEAVERVHAYFGDALADFTGDTGPFEAVRPTLEACLRAQYQPAAKRSSRRVWVIAGVVLVAGLAWLMLAWQARARWNAYLSALRSEPGIVVVSAGREAGSTS